MKIRMSLITYLVILLGWTCVQKAIAQDVVSYTRVGEKMPAFSITDTGGINVSISDLKGKIVLVNFWATWCAPCYAELPRLEKEVWLKYKSDEFVMIAIAREQSDREITAFREKVGFTFPIAADPKREVYKLFGNGGIPRSYVVATDGNILFQSVGYDDSEIDRMKKIIEAELKKLRKLKK